MRTSGSTFVLPKLFSNAEVIRLINPAWIANAPSRITRRGEEVSEETRWRARDRREKWKRGWITNKMLLSLTLFVCILMHSLFFLPPPSLLPLSSPSLLPSSSLPFSLLHTYASVSEPHASDAIRASIHGDPPQVLNCRGLDWQERKERVWKGIKRREEEEGSEREGGEGGEKKRRGERGRKEERGKKGERVRERRGREEREKGEKGERKGTERKAGSTVNSQQPATVHYYRFSPSDIVWEEHCSKELEGER
jgi:hypothetical protein